MHFTDASGAGPRWLKEALAGCTGALAVLPVVLTLGLLAFSPLGAAAMAVGMLASFVASTIGGGVHATLSGTRLPVSGPTSATALTLAFLVAHLVADPRLAADAVMGLPAVVALCGLAVLLSGALQIGFALLGMARLARVVPQPVLAGFMNRSLVHDRYRALERPSRRIYPALVEAQLQPLREGIVVFVIEGPLFFGSGDRLLDEAESLGANCRCLILDLSQVGAIDESGAVALQGLVSQASRRGVRVELSGLDEGTPPMQALRSFAPALPHWPDADRAVEAAELRLLGQGEWLGESESRGDVRAMAEVPLAESSLMAGLDAAQADVVSAHLLPRHLAAGEQLFAQGEPGDRLYVVSQGSISVLSTPNRSGRTQRYLSISPGMMLGETAMLDGGGRTAGAVADAPTVVHALTLEVLDALGRSHPDIAIRLHRNVALHLSQRLRGAAGAWRASAR
jgi:CRP-like cAMP-binding protein/anti-anti-sigma regulatory factor